MHGPCLKLLPGESLVIIVIVIISSINMLILIAFM